MPHKFAAQCGVMLTLVLPLAACAMPLTYSAEPIEAKVIDAETKQPIEGVIVTANWQLEEGTPGGNVSVGQLMVMETITDQDGKFAFPGWGPKTIWKGFFTNEDPQLLLFKSGYEYQRLYNEYNSTRELRTRKVRRSDWNDKTITLKPFKGSPEGRYKVLLGFSKGVESFTVHHPEPCNWLNVPQTLKTIMRERLDLESAGITSMWDRTLDKQVLDGEAHFRSACGAPTNTILQGIKKQ